MSERQIKFLAATILVVLLLPVFAHADWTAEKQKIDYLMDRVAHVEGVFIRNGVAYTPDQAVSHLRMKLSNAMNSWFAPNKEKWTAEMFIEKIASRSSISGKSYEIRFKNGKQVPAGEWLRKELSKRKGN